MTLASANTSSNVKIIIVGPKQFRTEEQVYTKGNIFQCCTCCNPIFNPSPGVYLHTVSARNQFLWGMEFYSGECPSPELGPLRHSFKDISRRNPKERVLTLGDYTITVSKELLTLKLA